MLFETYILQQFYNRKEGFDTTQNIGYALIFIYFFIIFLYSFGAAKLSWSYGTYIGSTFFSKSIWAFLAFLFSSIYYPMYAYFLNPVGQLRSSVRTNTPKLPSV